MGDLVRDKLAKLIGRFGPELVDDPKRCEGLLRDVCGQHHRREVFVLVSALREGVGTELRQTHAGTPVEVILARLETRLHDHLGLAEELARWAVQSWALVLGVAAADTLSAKHSGETESAVPGDDRSEGRNPHETRIKELVSELSKPPRPMPETCWEPRIRDVQNRLSRLAQFRIPTADSCPACHEPSLVQVTGEPTEHCPVCRQGRLEWRSFSLKHCPVCREGELHPPTDQTRRVLCPACRKAILKQHKQAGVPSAGPYCPECEAQFERPSQARVEVISGGHDQAYRGRIFLSPGDTVDLRDWIIGEQGISFLACRCGAGLVAYDRPRRLLVHVGTREPYDPYGVAMRYMGQSHSPETWAMLAMGLSENAGNRLCQQCGAEFQQDIRQGTMELREYDRPAFPWASEWQGKEVPAQIWYLAAAGKQSQRPGMLCTSCRAEFDANYNGLKLVSTSAPALSPFVGSYDSFENWHRRSARLPSSAEEDELRDELDALSYRQQAEKQEWERAESERTSGLRAELDRLVKVALLGGYLSPREHASQNVRLRDGEKLRWLGPATKLKLSAMRGQATWKADGEGMLFITTERILLDAPDQLWQKPLSRIFRVDEDRGRAGPVMVLKLDGQQKPVGLYLPASNLDVLVEGEIRKITFDISELVAFLKNTGGTEK